MSTSSPVVPKALVDEAPTRSVSLSLALATWRSGRGAARAWVGLLPALLLFGLAEFAVRQGWVPRHLLPAPSDVWWAADQLGWATLAEHAGVSTLRVLAGFAVGASLAFVAGALVGLKPSAEHLLDPSFQALRAIPSLAWVPLLLLWLGIDEASKVALIAIGAFFPVYLSVSSGLAGVDRKLVEVARMAQLGDLALVRRVLWPAALPAIFTGVRQGMSLAWMFMVAAELIAATRGLGYLLTDGRETGRVDLVLLAIVVLAVLGKVSDTALQQWERRALAWRDAFDSTR